MTRALATTLVLFAACRGDGPRTGEDGGSVDTGTTDGGAFADAPAGDDGGVPPDAPAPAEHGYVLFSPIRSTSTYLVRTDGELVHSWASSAAPGQAVLLLDGGRLLRTELVASTTFQAGGVGGRVVMYDWDGAVIWSREVATPTAHLHHDVEPLPDGHVLLIAWDLRTEDAARAAGRPEAAIPAGGVWSDSVLELDPATGEIVWAWYAWDHLLAAGERAVDHPERIDPGAAATPRADWLHVNSVHHDAAHDQILLSVHNTSEIWIVDHGGTTADAAGPRGDLLYRWGNPAMHGAAGARSLYAQHDAEWIGEDRVLVFDNGDMRLRPSSRVVELALPWSEADGAYTRTGDAFGPDAPAWQYAPTGADAFFAMNVSGAQRLRSGNTLVTEGTTGRLREVTPDGAIVWSYDIPTDTGMPAILFRAERYESDDGALGGRTLAPLGRAVAELDVPR